MKKLLFLSIILSLFFTACRKDYIYTPVSNTPIVFQDLTAYSYFKTGTYWIYKDSVTAIEDSVYVYYDTTFTYYRTGTVQKDGYYIYYGFRAHSFFDSFDYDYWINTGDYSISTGANGVWRSRTKPGDSGGQTFLMSNVFDKNATFYAYTSPGEIHFMNYYDSLNIDAINYKKVTFFYDTKNASEYNSPTRFYIAKNIGIVRKEKLDTLKIWNLIRYHIIQ